MNWVSLKIGLLLHGHWYKRDCGYGCRFFLELYCVFCSYSINILHADMRKNNYNEACGSYLIIGKKRLYHKVINYEFLEVRMWVQDSFGSWQGIWY